MSSTENAIPSGKIEASSNEHSENEDPDSVVAQVTDKNVRGLASNLLSSKHVPTAVSTATLSNTYSPIKYTDDDIIIKDFKPIRMRDVYPVLQQQESNNKENSAPNQQP